MRHYFLIMKSRKKKKKKKNGPKNGGAIEFSFPISLMIKWAFKSSKEVTPITIYEINSHLMVSSFYLNMPNAFVKGLREPIFHILIIYIYIYIYLYSSRALVTPRLVPKLTNNKQKTTKGLIFFTIRQLLHHSI